MSYDSANAVMLYLAAGEPHALEAAVDSSFLLTLVARRSEVTP